MPGVGIDEWVARSEDKREYGPGWRGQFARLDERVGWWPRLGIAAGVGVLFGLSGPNVNLEQTAFNCLLYAMLALGLNIAVGWAGLLDLGYVAFFGFGAYAYAVFSSTAFGNAGSGGSHLPAFATLAIAFGAGLIVGLLVGLVALRLSGDYLAIVTLFVGQA